MTLSTLTADLLLMHAPAVFEFRNRRDICFPFLGTSGDIPITPLYEYLPVGFKSLQRYLRDRGHQVEIVNLSSLFIRYPELDLDVLLDALDVRVVRRPSSSIWRNTAVAGFTAPRKNTGAALERASLLNRIKHETRALPRNRCRRHRTIRCIAVTMPDCR